MPPRLIINADDFGLTPGINRAIVELYRAGVITSATLMATGPAFEDAAALARANPGLGVGCHLVFVDGMPLSHAESIPSLLGADGKCFRPSIHDFAQATLRNTIGAADLARETAAQIQRIQRAGIDVTHVDSHKHTHLFPAIAKTVTHIARRCGVSAMRYPFEPQWSAEISRETTPLMRRLQLKLLHRFESGFRALTDTSGETTTAGTLGIAATGTLEQNSLRELLNALLARKEDGTLYELCCHPGHMDIALGAESNRLRETREAEYRALLAVIPEIREHPNRPELIHYGSLGVPGLQRASGQFTPNTGYEKVL
jgi:hopanoid biosynthesis associated protein HpnK